MYNIWYLVKKKKKKKPDAKDNWHNMYLWHKKLWRDYIREKYMLDDRFIRHEKIMEKIGRIKKGVKKCKVGKKIL